MLGLPLSLLKSQLEHQLALTENYQEAASENSPKDLEGSRKLAGVPVEFPL